MNDWVNFLLAQAGASAALAGLVFVGVSINLSKILSISRLPDRALVALLLLLTVLIVSSLLLVPGQPQSLIGGEVLVTGLVIWTASMILDARIWRNTEPRYRRGSAILILANQCAALAYIISGVTILSQGLVGLYWLVPAVILSFVKAILDAWVLLVEINR